MRTIAKMDHLSALPTIVENILCMPRGLLRLVQRTRRFNMRRCAIIFANLVFFCSIACDGQPPGVNRAAVADSEVTQTANLSGALTHLLLVASTAPELTNMCANWSQSDRARRGRMEFIVRRVISSASSRALGARSRSTISTVRRHLVMLR